MKKLFLVRYDWAIEVIVAEDIEECKRLATYEEDATIKEIDGYEVVGQSGLIASYWE